MLSGNFKHVVLLIDAGHEKYYSGLCDSLKDCRTLSIPDADDACRYFFNNQVDIVLLDCSNSSSVEELKFLKSVKPSVPVIVMTSAGSEEFAVSAFRNGARDYFRKPFNIDELVTRIGGILLFRPGSARRKSDYSVDNFRTAVQHMIDNYNLSLRLPQISRIAGMSVSSFERAFRKKMNTTFTLYLNTLRIKHSARLLTEGSFSVSEVAFICGFTNQFHFTRTFRKIMNASPSAYKNNNRYA